MPQENRENFFTDLLKFALIAVVIVVPVRLFIAQPYIVSGASMDPTFENGQYIIVDELTYQFDEPKRGDVVIFKYPKDPTTSFIKRIIGLPGETVQVSQNSVTITKKDGGKLDLDESYIVNRDNGSGTTVTLSDSEYFVMGDNRPASSDSRQWGTLPRENIIGRAFLRLFPIDTVSLLPGSTPAQN